MNDDVLPLEISNKKARVKLDHGPCKISLASATRLSQWDPWLSVPRLLVVWLYRQYVNFVFLLLFTANIMPRRNLSINLLISKKLFGELLWREDKNCLFLSFESKSCFRISRFMNQPGSKEGYHSMAERILFHYPLKYSQLKRYPHASHSCRNISFPS